MTRVGLLGPCPAPSRHVASATPTPTRRRLQGPRGVLRGPCSSGRRSASPGEAAGAHRIDRSCPVPSEARDQAHKLASPCPPPMARRDTRPAHNIAGAGRSLHARRDAWGCRSLKARTASLSPQEDGPPRAVRGPRTPPQKLAMRRTFGGRDGGRPGGPRASQPGAASATGPRQSGHRHFRWEMPALTGAQDYLVQRLPDP